MLNWINISVEQAITDTTKSIRNSEGKLAKMRNDMFDERQKAQTSQKTQSDIRHIQTQEMNTRTVTSMAQIQSGPHAQTYRSNDNCNNNNNNSVLRIRHILPHTQVSN